MATTRNFAVGPLSWVRIASGRPDGQSVKIDGDAPFVIAFSVGPASLPPDLPLQTGHRVSAGIDIPLVASQHLWACAPSLSNLTVT